MVLSESASALQVLQSDSWCTQNPHQFTDALSSAAQNRNEQSQNRPKKLGIWRIFNVVRSAEELDPCRRGYCGMAKRSTAVGGMTTEQAALLRKLAFDAYEPEAFAPNLTKVEAQQRIEALKAKLKLMGEPPHTL